VIFCRRSLTCELPVINERMDSGPIHHQREEAAIQIVTASYRNWRPELGSPVVASLLVPKWLLPEGASWPRLWAATPRWAYWKAEPDDFDRLFLAQLETYGPERIARQLAGISKASGSPERLCLLCWEDKPEHCHRSTFAAWWLARVGEVVEEVN
jgi:hypothetical protein